MPGANDSVETIDTHIFIDSAMRLPPFAFATGLIGLLLFVGVPRAEVMGRFISPEGRSALFRTAKNQLATAPVGRIAGVFDVTDGGAASYRIPLIVPPGRRGMQPSVALVYNSQQGDGVLGMGWTIAGFSEVSRCPRVPARNGIRRPVELLDARDRRGNPDQFCLDGEWLVLVKGRSGQDGAEYRTERESFRRVIGVGTPHVTFRVFERDGLVREYGTANKCQDAPQGAIVTGTCTAVVYARGGLIRSWMLARVTDRFGNYMTYDYARIADSHVEDVNGDDRLDDERLAETTEILPQRIRYTGHEGDGLVGQRAVVFDYEQRPDSSSGYYSGLHVQRRWRLKRIVTTLEGRGDILEYRLTYSRSGSTGRSRLSSINLCTGSRVCGQPTLFDWTPGVQLFDARINTQIPAPAVGILANRRFSMRDLVAADFTGDGQGDLAFPRDGTWRLVTAHGLSSQVMWKEANSGVIALPEASAQVMDYNQDGRQDLFIVDNTETAGAGTPVTFRVLRGGPGGFSEIDTGIEYFRPVGPFSSLVTRVHLVDLDGDGIQDLLTCGLIQNGRAAGDTPQQWTYRIHTGSAFGEPHLMPMFPERTSQLGCRDDKPFFVDVDGDGSTNLMIPTGPSYQAAIPWDLRTHTWTFRDTGLPSFVGYFDGARAVDLNGDGLDDVVWQMQGQQTVAQTWFNTGRGFVGGAGVRQNATQAIIQALSNDRGEFSRALPHAQPIDVNLDGRVDLLIPPIPCQVTGNRNTGTITADCNEPGRIGTTWTVLKATGERSAFDETGFPLTRQPLSIPYTNTDKSGVVYDAETTYQRPRVVDVDANLLPDLVLVEGECSKPQEVPEETLLEIADRIQRRSVGFNPGDLYIIPSPPRPGCFVVYLSTGFTPDLLHGVREGLHTTSRDPPEYTYEIDYASTRPGPSAVYSPDYVSSDPFYSMNRPACTASLPCRRPAMILVSRVRADRGPNLPPNDIRYTWHDARFDRQGRGFTGFGQRTVSETSPSRYSVTRLDNTTRYTLGDNRYVYPYSGAALDTRTTMSLGATLLSRQVTTALYDTRRLNGDRTWMSYAQRTIARSEEIGSALGTTTPALLASDTTRHFPDDFGNDTVETRGHLGGVRERIVSRYRNYTGRWLVGLVQSQTVSSTVDGVTQRRVSSTEYDEALGVPRRTVRAPTEQSRSRVLEWQYDRFGHVERTTESAPTLASERTTITDSLDAERIFQTRTTNALGHVTIRRFDSRFGVPLSSVDPNGVTSTWTYDDFGRLVEQSVGGGATTTTQYEFVNDGGTTGHLRVTTRGTGVPTHAIDFDRLARPVRERITRLDGRVAEFRRTYGMDGRLRDVELPHFDNSSAPIFERFTVDAIGRMVRHRRADGTEVVITPRGRTTEIRDARGFVTTKETNGIGQIVSIRDPSGGGLTRYTYGPFGVLKRIVDAAGNATAMDYDDYGRLVSIRDPDAGLRTYEYDAFDRRTLDTDALGRKTESRFDAIDRILRRTDAEGVSTFSYDSTVNGRGLISAARGPGNNAQRYHYDAMGRLSERIQRIEDTEYSERFTYTETGRVKLRTLMNAAWTTPIALSYDYAANGALRAIRERSADGTESSLWAVRNVDASGRLLREQFGNGLLGIRSYDAESGELEELIVRSSAGTVLQHLALRHDAAGNVTRRTDMLAIVRESFGYDALHRVVADTVCRGGGPCLEPRVISYDAIGNVTKRSDIGAYSYLPAHPHAVVSAGAATFGYDAVGNQITRQGTRIAYTTFNKPRLQQAAMGTTAFEYDAFRILTVRRANEEVVHYSNAVIRRRRGEVTEDEIPVRVGERTVALLVEQRTTTGRQRQRLFVHDDHLGSPFLLTNAAGQPIGAQRFDPFGRLLSGDWGSAPQTQPAQTRALGFTGHLSADDLGLVDMGGRVYDPTIGRFISADPVVSQPFNSQALNRYSYVLNNPLTHRDPTGFAPEGEGPVGGGDDDDDPPVMVTAEGSTEDCGALFCSIGMPFQWDRDNGLTPLNRLQRVGITLLGPAGISMTTTWDVASQVSKGDLSVVPVVGPLQAFDHDNEAMLDAIIEDRGLAAAGYAVLSLGDGVFAVVDALSLGELSLATGAGAGQARAAVRNAIEKAPEMLAKACNSFDGDTPVWSADGSLVPIRHVVPGQVIASIDSLGRIPSAARVTATQEHVDRLLFELTVGGETLRTTPGHRFLTLRRGWVPALALTVTDTLRGVDGRLGRVTEKRPIARARSMFNLTVAETHTFAVGRGGWIAHNQNNCLVYIARNAQGALIYVGITNNFRRRSWQHLNVSKVRKNIEEVQEFLLDKLTPADARNVEQALIQLSGGIRGRGNPANPTMVNQINSISPARSTFQARVDAGMLILQQRGWIP